MGGGGYGMGAEGAPGSNGGAALRVTLLPSKKDTPPPPGASGSELKDSTLSALRRLRLWPRGRLKEGPERLGPAPDGPAPAPARSCAMREAG